jgi:hypothetical protein
LAWTLNADERSSSLSGRFTPERKTPDCYLLIRRDGHQRRADPFGEEKNIFSLPEIEYVFLGNPICRLFIVPTVLEAVDNQTLLSFKIQL